MAPLFWKNLNRVFYTLFIIYFSFFPLVKADTYIKSVQANTILKESILSLETILAINGFRDQFVDQLHHSLAIMIFPSSWKVGLFFLSFGSRNGILLIKAPNGQWSFPTFWSMHNFNMGLTFGFQSGSAIMIFKKSKTIGYILKDQFMWGSGITGSIGSQGSGKRFLTFFPPPTGGISLFSSNGGFFVGAEAGLNTLRENNSLTEAFYHNTLANTKTVIIEGKFFNAKAQKLRDWLHQYSQ